MASRPYPIDPALTAIAIAFRNAGLIADLVLPRTPSVNKQEFKYFEYPLAESFTVPDTQVARRGRVNEVSFTGTEKTESTQDYGLEDPIPQDDIDNASGPQTPLQRSTEQLTNLLALDREIRVARMVFNPATYGAANKEVVATTDKFTAADADPIKMLSDALDQMLMRANCMVLGQAAWTALRQHPKIVKATNRNSGDAGAAARQAVAELFEVKEIMVGEGFLNNARKGQAANLQRVWGGHCALLHIERLADTRNGMSFGYTVPYQTRIAGSRVDPDIGLRGGQRLRVGESLKELITAPALGYFLEGVV